MQRAGTADEVAEAVLWLGLAGRQLRHGRVHRGDRADAELR